MTAGKRKRRGIILLLVISLLTLFILIGVTYAVVASVYRDTAKGQAARNLVGDPPEREIENVMYVLLRDSLQRSPLQYHSLLFDLYGDDGFRGTLSSAVTAENESQVWKFSISTTTQPFGHTVSAIDDYYNGQVLTFVSGPARGISTRILRYNGSTNEFYIETKGADGLTMPTPISGDAFVVNGRPFNGTGFGYDASGANPNIEAKESTTNQLSALLPNSYARSSVTKSHYLGADESWDAPDFQNMILAMVPPRRATDSSVGIIPSFHRPDLVNYWYAKVIKDYLDPAGVTGAQQKQVFLFPYGPNGVPGDSDDPAQPDLATRNIIARILGMITFRPQPGFHPNFTGGNPNFNPMQQDPGTTWDVDNDNDGIADSIWVDPGLPVLTAPNGRRYKRLTAVLVKDLDGRLNVNAHANSGLANASYLAVNDISTTGNLAGFTSGQVAKLPRGLGFGPAEVLLQHIFDNTLASQTDANALLGYRHNGTTPGGGGLDGFAYLKNHGVPNNHYSTVTGSWYMSPPDTWGRSAIALDHAGQPVTVGAGLDGEGTDNPYFSSGGMNHLNGDPFFTPAEFEYLLRKNDADSASLPRRLTDAAANLANNTSSGAARRELITPISSHIPSTRMPIPNESTLRTALGNAPSRSIIDLYKQRMGSNFSTAEMNKMLPWEFRQGVPFNINRWLGNGRDDDGDNIVDEIDEAGSEKWNEPAFASKYPSGFNNAAAFLTDGVTSDPKAARHLFARHLYCLMIMLIDPNYLPSYTAEAGLSQDQKKELFRRRIAQWAVNVVDFRDPDSICTPFEYDYAPENGWNVDGDISATSTDNNHTDRRLVWGMEMPELLISETKAFHDLRLIDTDKDDGVKKKLGDPNPPSSKDRTFDQYRLPEGSLFVELFCPKMRVSNPGGTARSAAYPRELYDFSGGSYALNLKKVAPASANGMQYPVWQIAISKDLSAATDTQYTLESLANSKPYSASLDPTESSLLQTGGANPVIDRYVWFTSQEPTDAATKDKVFYNSLNYSAQVKPGQYAVVGPRPITYLGGKRRAASDKWSPALQAIQLNKTAPLVDVLDVSGASVMPNTTTTIQPPVSIVADMTPPAINATLYPAPAGWPPNFRVGMNISEPMPASGYYLPPPPDPSSHIPPDAYTQIDVLDPPVPDEPFDFKNSSVLSQGNMTRKGTYTNRRVIYLQRLADPTAAFHKDYNPYLTVDIAMTDLTVFNGEEDGDPQFGVNSLQFKFGSRERGSAEKQTAGNVNGNLWLARTQDPANTSGAGGTDYYFDHKLVNTFGFLNAALGTPRTSPASNIGDPNETPFPWLTWLDRPFASPAELMLVPACTSVRLGLEMPQLKAPGTARATVNIYDPANENLPFGHLLNFFSTMPSSGTGNPTPHFYRLFDYVESPSPFVGAEEWFNPSTSGSHFGSSTATAVSSIFRPPFNSRSNFRNPGRININTIFDDEVLQGIVKQYPALANHYNKIVQSRQGYASGNYQLNSDYPTMFANPFRPADAADLMPDVGTPSMRQKSPIAATLMRPTSNTDSSPLFAFKSEGGAYQMTPYTAQMCNDSDRNAYFKYQPYQKLTNLLTTNSNCYAVWITVGYFEVEDNPSGVDDAHRDGLRLAAEIGSDSGQIVRHRGFYMIDRSIPVAFEPGENHNVDRCILVRRVIE